MHALAKHAYYELNLKIEKMCSLTYVTFVYGSIFGYFVPAMLKTLVNYSIFDLKAESYILPIPAW